MKRRLLEVIGVGVVVVGVAGLLLVARGPSNGTSAPTTDAALKTPWGDPDLQGIWTDPYQTPLQRPTQYANKETFTDEERESLDKQRAGLLRRDQRVERGSERDVAGAYNAVFQSIRPTGRRTSLIVDPPDGRLPALTAEAMKRNELEREFRLALLQPTQTCKNKEAACAGGKFGPVSPRRNEAPPLYNTGRTNRNDGPEDRSMAERCMGAVLPDFGGYRRIVQSPGTVSILLRHRPGAGMAARHPRGWHAPPSAVDPSALRRFARPMGRKHAGRRRHQLLPEVRLSGGAREPASRRALYAREREDRRIQRHHRRSDHVDEAVDG